MAVGPLVGGVLTEGFGWEWIFFVNVPIGIAAVVLTLAKVRGVAGPGRARHRLGRAAATFAARCSCSSSRSIRGNDEGWGSTVIVCCSAVLGRAARVLRGLELRQERPMLDLSLFRKPAFAGASVVAFALSASMFAMFLYLTLYLQNILGFSPLEAGLRFLPLTVLSFFVAPIAGRLSERVPVRGLLGGGLAARGHGLLLMGGLDRRVGVDRAARRAS